MPATGYALEIIFQNFSLLLSAMYNMPRTKSGSNTLLQSLWFSIPKKISDVSHIKGGGGEVVGERERNKACLWFGMEERKEKTDQLRTSFLSITQSNGLNEHTWVTSSRPFNINDTSLQWERRRQSVTTDYQCNKVQLCWLYAWKVER